MLLPSAVSPRKLHSAGDGAPTGFGGKGDCLAGDLDHNGGGINGEVVILALDGGLRGKRQQGEEKAKLFHQETLRTISAI
jgi:hypothetical protein